MSPFQVRPFSLALLLALFSPFVRGVELGYYLPDEIQYEAGIPTPEEYLGYEVGEWHVRHDQMVGYMKALAEASDRIDIQITGHTYEERELLLLTITAPENLSRTESIRKAHFKLSRANSEVESLEEGPVVVYMGYSIHGDESSGGNAALVVAYYFAAAQSSQVEHQLSNTVILLDPCMNPDGFSRFAQWANSHRGRKLVADSNHREHLAVWPAGRGNHYWFDLNRDWLLLQHPESRARIRQFHFWKPNVLTDFHEMGSDATYFFQPGVPERKNPLTPLQNVRLTETFASFHAQALDELGSLYYTEERFDDYYYGKGSTYPDIQGAVGILFEQASSRGHLKESEQGNIDFPFTIRNQVRTSLSSIAAASENRINLLKYQQEFYKHALAAAKEHKIQGYIFGDPTDAGRNRELLDILLLHDIEVYTLQTSYEVENMQFQPGRAWVVPMQQAQYRLARTMFERQTEFPDNIFYDVSAWTFPLALGIPYASLKELPEALVGQRVRSLPSLSAPPVPAETPYAYAFEWNQFHAPRALYRLLHSEVKTRVATKPLEAVGEKPIQFDRGTVIIPMGIQESTSRAVRRIVNAIARKDGVKVHPLYSGLTPEGIDIGSPSLEPLQKPVPLVVVGEGVSAYESGEVWHLLDQRVGMPVSLVEGDRIHRIDLKSYTHLVLVSGGGSNIHEKGIEKIQRWIQEGGVLIAIRGGAKWASEKKLAEVEFQEGGTKQASQEKKNGKPEVSNNGPKDDSEKSDYQRENYGDYESIEDAKRLSGAFFEGDLDITHPIGYGYRDRRLALFRNSRLCMFPSKNPYQTVVMYSDNPVLSGYVHAEELAKLKNTASVVAEKKGEGSVILMVDNPNFRAYTHGTSRMFCNAVFFGSTIRNTKVE